VPASDPFMTAVVAALLLLLALVCLLACTGGLPAAAAPATAG
jgi:hypothetical protein